MLTLRAAATLLAAEPGRPALAAIAASAGFDGPALALDDRACDALGLRDHIADAAVIARRGALRALLIRSRPDLRVRLPALARALARRTPQLLWLVVAEDESGDQRGLAAWIADRASPHTAMLLVERGRVTDSDAEALAAIAAARSDSDTMTHARWVEVLGREALTRRFYGTLASIVARAADTLPLRIPLEDRGTLALLTTSRLLFLAFLEARGWLDGDREFIARHFIDAAGGGHGIHRRVVDPLFFGTLNTRPSSRAPVARAFGRIPYLNGGLFTRSALERRWRRVRFPDEALAPVVDELLSRYRLTTREQAVGSSEAAVDPEMLGRAFETLMASRERRASGAFYTPQQIVADATAQALVSYLDANGVREDAARSLIAGGDIGAAVHRAGDALSALRLVDPACGSGAFLVYALDRVAELRRRCGAAGDVSALRRDTLARCIFGVDSNPTAVWLCELRLWLAAVVEEQCDDPLAVPPLPNLDHNIRVGDSLAGGSLLATAHGDGMKVERLRLRYARATGARKAAVARELETTHRRIALKGVDLALATANHRRRELLLAARGRDLFGKRAILPVAALAELRQQVRSLCSERQALSRGAAMPFAWSAAFPDVAARGGFDVVIGNPPWVRLHNIPPRARDRLRREFEVFRLASWTSGADGAGAGRGFAAQVDLAALFVERAIQLVRAGGTIALLLPAKLWRSLAGGGVRRLLVRRAPPISLDDWSESAVAFDAAVYPSLLVACATPTPRHAVSCTLRHRHEMLRWELPRPQLPLDETDGSPWIIAPAPVRAGFDALRTHGVPLAASIFGRPRLGIKCGHNEAFVLADGDADVEPAMVRPLIRGETLRAWQAAPAERMLWTHDESGEPLGALPQRAARHLARFQRVLAARSDARHGARWWSVFRVDGALPGAPRVVWADVGRAPRAACLGADDPTLALNSCYIARCPTTDDALALTALLNSPLVAAWLSLVAEPARGGYRRFLGWTMALLPVPRDWSRARDLLAPVARRAVAGEPPTPGELLALAVRAYRVRSSDVARLVEWVHR